MFELQPDIFYSVAASLITLPGDSRALVPRFPVGTKSPEQRK